VDLKKNGSKASSTANDEWNEDKQNESFESQTKKRKISSDVQTEAKSKLQKLSTSDTGEDDVAPKDIAKTSGNILASDDFWDDLMDDTKKKHEKCVEEKEPPIDKASSSKVDDEW